MKRKEYTSCLVKYTKDESPTRGFNPPKQYVKGKVIQRQVESFWARCESTANESSDEERTEFTCGIWLRTSSSKYKDLGLISFTKKELGDVVPLTGDSLWIWTWEEERIGVGIIVRCHIEVETRILTEEERVEIRGLCDILKEELTKMDAEKDAQP